MGARVESLSIAGELDVWRSIGLVADADGLIPLIGTSLRVEPDPHRRGLVGWDLSGVDPDLDGSNIDGLPTRVVQPRSPSYAAHDIGASALDHVVVMTPDLDRTTDAVEAATGCELKRVREVGTMRQGFHRIGQGGLIVEVVTRPEIPDGPAAFWGIVLIVDDLDAACARIGGDGISDPKDAVQPGRRIATVHGDVGLGVPLALMTA